MGRVETGDTGEIMVNPASLLAEVSESTKQARGLDVSAHARNFFDCMRSRELTAANQHVMRRSHVACHAAAIAWILQRRIKIDPVTETFVDDDEANSLRSRPIRKWS
jgi:hypothetical protein